MSSKQNCRENANDGQTLSLLRKEWKAADGAFAAIICISVFYFNGRDGVALCVLGMGKVNAALTTMAVLSAGRFDYSQAYILSTG